MATVANASTSFDPEADIRQLVRNSKIGLVGFLALAVGAGTLIPIGGAVIASGQLGTETHTKRISHPIGGTIKQIFVKEGDHVAAGAPLMRFDDTVSTAESDLSSLSVDQLLAQRARLEAERVDAGAISFPAALTNGHPGAEQAMDEERRLFTIRQGEASAMREQLRSRIAQLGQQIGGYQAQIGALRKQQTLIDPERENMQALYKRGLVTLSRLNQLERTSVDADGSVAMLQAQIAQTRGKISETREQLLQMNQTRRSDAGTQLASLNSQLNEQTMRNISARDIKYRSLIRAPYAGVVNKISFFTLGEVVRPAEPIMEIVPDKDRMTVEVQINPTDVEQVQSGAKARVRFSSLNSTATPEVTGVVTLVAPDRTTNPQTGQSYFAARVAVDPKDIARHRELALRVGMPAEVFIETGDRSMMSYLTKPLRDQFARAFRDN